MNFEVIRSNDNAVVMHTDSSSCITTDEIDMLSSAGYKFRVDGKLVSKQVAKQYATSVSESNPVVTEPVTGTKMVHCVTTGETFKNQSLAAKKYNIDPAQVSDSIKTGRPRSGYVFEYVYQ